MSCLSREHPSFDLRLYQVSRLVSEYFLEILFHFFVCLFVCLFLLNTDQLLNLLFQWGKFACCIEGICLCKLLLVAPWYRVYHYCITSFNKAWTQVLRRFKSWSRCIGYSRWWGSLTMFPAGKKVIHLSSANHTTKTIHHDHQSEINQLN